MNIEIITSFHKPYFDLIGKDCIESWIKYWPKEVRLTCYVEDFIMPVYDRINCVSFDKLGEDYESFQSGNYGRGTKKFAKKAFSFIHAMEHSDADRIVWVDADTITKKTISLPFLKSLLPDDKLSTHMGVTYLDSKDGRTGKWFVPETGFFAINKKHAMFSDFLELYKKTYVKGKFTGLRRQYDNDVYGYAIKKLKAPSFDLCEKNKKSYKTPLKHTILGEYLYHFKAKHSKHMLKSADVSVNELISD
jgi:cellulose synthase/poly-beta-1,6-N-acetylglucosamine synthase-like glycosyltransferase